VQGIKELQDIVDENADRTILGLWYSYLTDELKLNETNKEEFFDIISKTKTIKNIKKEDIAHDFNQNVANLVDGVTKLNKINFTSDSEASAAYQRKILVGLSEDVRVIIIKLADRLHNMRTLDVMSEEKQKKKAKETLARKGSSWIEFFENSYLNKDLNRFLKKFIIWVNRFETSSWIFSSTSLVAFEWKSISSSRP
jgi:ribosomal protein S18